MEVKEFIKGQLDGADQAIKRVMETLTQEEIAWQPKSGCNPIGLILFHIYQDGRRIYQSHGEWQRKSSGRRINGMRSSACRPTKPAPIIRSEQVDAFKVPKLQAIVDYGAAVRKDTLAYLDTLKPADFDKKIEMRFGPMPLAIVFSILVSHAAPHTGEMSYIRGLKRGMDK